MVYKDKESEAATATLTVVVDAINGVVVPTDAKVSVHTLGGPLCIPLWDVERFFLLLLGEKEYTVGSKY